MIHGTYAVLAFTQQACVTAGARRRRRSAAHDSMATVQAELDLLAEAVRRIEGAARSVWPGCRAALFGSQATGLALPGADLDVVVLGASTQLQRAGSGFTKASVQNMIRLQGH